jgi:L-alanine-DL-glutamate epimerase-like enolase superfamily enzyme
VFEALPSAWIEDPAVADDTSNSSTATATRITWGRAIHSVADIEALPWKPVS